MLKGALGALLAALLLWVAFTPSRPTHPRAERGKPPLFAQAHPPRAKPPEPRSKTVPEVESPETTRRELACPESMVLVDGAYCPEPIQRCLTWLDDSNLPYARCAKYETSPSCKGERQHKRFCIDRFEFSEPGKPPLNNQSYLLAARICKKQGKRLCTESEWNFACEGEEMRPYPYGFERRAVCNQDNSDLFTMLKGRQVLKDLTRASNLQSECKSPFGVIDMVGNLDEPVRRESGVQPNFNNGLKGGWWMAGRNRCRPATTAHNDYYRGLQIGVRCCAEAK